MKKLLFFSLAAILALPAMAGTTKTTTTSTYEETSASPAVMGSDSDMIEAEEYDESLIKMKK